MNMTNKKMQAVGLLVSVGIAGSASAASVATTAIGMAIESQSGGVGSAGLVLDFNDDSVADVLIDGVSTDASGLTLASLATATTVTATGFFDIGEYGITGLLPIEEGDTVGSVVAPEVTGSYVFTLSGVTPVSATSINLIFDVAFSIFEDTTPDGAISGGEVFTGATPGDSTGLSNGDLFAVLETDSYVFNANFSSIDGSFIIANLITPTNLSVVGGSILSDPFFFDGVAGIETFVTAVSTTITPASSGSFNFQDNASFEASIVPSPSAMVCGLFGIGAVAVRRRRE